MLSTDHTIPHFHRGTRLEPGIDLREKMSNRNNPGSPGFIMKMMIAGSFLVMLLLPASGQWEWRQILEPSGLAAGLLLAATLLVSPIVSVWPSLEKTGLLNGLRRLLGLSAFSFACLHMAGTVLALGRLDYVLQGLAWTSIWTGWVAFAFLLLPALSSVGWLRASLGRHWKTVQRLTWPAAFFAVWHWYLQSHGGWLFWIVVLFMSCVELTRLIYSQE